MSHATQAEVAYAKDIDKAEDFIELIAVVSAHGAVQGSSREFSRGELVTGIATIKSLAEDGYDATPEDFRRITRSLGLRHKCKELYAKRRG